MKSKSKCPCDQEPRWFSGILSALRRDKATTVKSKQKGQRSLICPLTSGYSLTGTKSFSCSWATGPTASGSSSMSRPLNMPPFSVSLYMSLRTLPISLGGGGRKRERRRNYESLSMEEGDSKFHISFFSSVRFLGRWLTVARIKGSSDRQTGRRQAFCTTM